MMRIGAHLTITKGLDKAAEMAVEIGGNTFQFFTRNPRGGKARQIPAEEISRWLKRREELDVYPAVGHFPYTVNLASLEDKQKDFAHLVLHDDLLRMSEAGVELAVSHPGRYDQDKQENLKRLTELIASVMEEISPSTFFCLETMALQGREIGSIEDLSSVLDALANHPQVGIALDSAHLFAAGWDLRTKEGCRRLVEALDQKIGLSKVKFMHLNDTKVPLGSHKDRHEKIGYGILGKKGIEAIIEDEFLGSLPLILETPVADYKEYAAEIQAVKAIAAFWGLKQ